MIEKKENFIKQRRPLNTNSGVDTHFSKILIWRLMLRGSTYAEPTPPDAEIQPFYYTRPRTSTHIPPRSYVDGVTWAPPIFSNITAGETQSMFGGMI